MNGIVIGIIIFIVAVLAGPFLALRAVAHFRARRAVAKPAVPAAKPDADDDDKSSF